LLGALSSITACAFCALSPAVAAVIELRLAAFSEYIHPFLEHRYSHEKPFMGIFLSAANRAAGSARAQAKAALKREAAKNVKQLTAAWTNSLLPPVAAPRRKKRPAK
jgi:hypothetical protein